VAEVSEEEMGSERSGRDGKVRERVGNKGEG